MIVALDRESASECDDKAVLSHGARQKAEAEVMGDLRDIERQEAALVWQAQAQGPPCEHRADINALALLGLRMVTAPRFSGLPATAPEHGYDIVGGHGDRDAHPLQLRANSAGMDAQRRAGFSGPVLRTSITNARRRRHRSVASGSRCC
jgi:hypothetical protein